MDGFDIDEYASLLIKGHLIEAFQYVKQFEDQRDLVTKYEKVFVENERLNRSTNPVVNAIDSLYQQYYKAIFWHNVSPEIAEAELFLKLWQYCGENDLLEKNASIEKEVEKRIQKEGFEFLGGRTSGFWGPYIWASSNQVTYDVSLPFGNEAYTIVLMDGFVSRSWLDFISFGKVGTGGWSGKDGLLYCVGTAYDLESQNFKISFLKHEAQHHFDERTFLDLSGEALEYRAKLVELIYWQDEKILKMIHLEADDSKCHNAHSVASHRIISDLSRRLFDKTYVDDLSLFLNELEKVKMIAGELLVEDNKRLTERNASL